MAPGAHSCWGLLHLRKQGGAGALGHQCLLHGRGGPPLRALSSESSGTESQGEVGGAPAPSSQNSSVLVALPLRPLGVTSQTHLPLAVQPALVSPYPYLPPPLAPCEGCEVLVAFTTDSSPGGDLLDPKACLCPFKCSAHIRVTTAMLDLDIYLLFSSSHEC